MKTICSTQKQQK